MCVYMIYIYNKLVVLKCWGSYNVFKIFFLILLFVLESLLLNMFFFGFIYYFV